MTLDDIIQKWNDQVDSYNQWDSLGEDEKLEWVCNVTKTFTLESLIQSELLMRVKKIREKSEGQYTTASIKITSYIPDVDTELECYFSQISCDDKEHIQEQFTTLPALIDHMDKLIKE
jgi:hypothetical protein